MITEGDKQQLRKILFSPQWEVITRLADEMCSDIQARSKVGETEWDTAKKAVNDEGEQRGMKSLLQRILDLGQQST